MIESFSKLWNLLTVFFTVSVVTDPVFSGMMIFTAVFGLLFIFKWFFDGGFVKW